MTIAQIIDNRKGGKLAPSEIERIKQKKLLKSQQSEMGDEIAKSEFPSKYGSIR